MRFNEHSKFVSQHAFLSPSNYHWVNYDEQKLTARWTLAQAARRGTELHDLASNLIRLGVKLPKTPTTMNLYVNDAIGYRMTSEQVLFYSENAFGTCDAICFRRNKLRIHDLKTGVTKTSVQQLEIYAALFCLEYKMKPHHIEIELRIYQSDEVLIFEADPDTIAHVMDRIVTFDKYINALRMEDL